MEQGIFYLLAATTVAGTILAITERHTVHAIIYLVTSFFALSIIFYLLGAPLVAVFEVIIYAGAIMVLFLFVIMMLDLGHPEQAKTPGVRDWWPAVVLGAIILGAGAALVAEMPAGKSSPPPVSLRDFSHALFQEYGIAVELISMQLLFALVGALYLARRRSSVNSQPEEENGGRS